MTNNFSLRDARRLYTEACRAYDSARSILDELDERCREALDYWFYEGTIVAQRAFYVIDDKRHTAGFVYDAAAQRRQWLLNAYRAELERAGVTQHESA